MHSAEHKPNLRCNKEGAKRIVRPAGNSEFWDDDEKCQGRYAFEELEGELQIVGSAAAHDAV